MKWMHAAIPQWTLSLCWGKQTEPLKLHPPPPNKLGLVEEHTVPILKLQCIKMKYNDAVGPSLLLPFLFLLPFPSPSLTSSSLPFSLPCPHSPSPFFPNSVSLCSPGGPHLFPCLSPLSAGIIDGLSTRSIFTQQLRLFALGVLFCFSHDTLSCWRMKPVLLLWCLLWCQPEKGCSTHPSLVNYLKHPGK